MMYQGVVVDAQIVNYMFREPQQNGPISSAINAILANHGIVVTEIIREEWLQALGPALKYWMEQQYVGTAKIREVPAQPNRGIRKVVRGFGLPLGHRDLKYIELAAIAKPHYILSQDMDFYEPSKKVSSGKGKSDARFRLQGKLHRALKKRFGIRTGCLCHCKEDLGLVGLQCWTPLPSCDC